VLHQHEWIDQHADRHEEDREKQVANRLDERLDRLAVAGFGDERASDECTKRHGIPEGEREKRRGEADADARHQCHLPAAGAHHGPHQPRNQQQPEADERDEKSGETHTGHREVAG
jgi:hypothetical protein